MSMLPAGALGPPVLDAEMVPPSASRIWGARNVMFPPGPVPAVVLKSPDWPLGDVPAIVTDSAAVTSMVPAGPLPGSTPTLAPDMAPPPTSWICGARGLMSPPAPVPEVVLKRPDSPNGHAPLIVTDPV